MRHILRLFLALATVTGVGVQAEAAKTVMAQSFGAVGDGKTDDWWPIQRGIDLLSAQGGGTIVLPGTASNTYIIRQALRMRSNVIVNVQQPNTTVKCTGDYWNGGKPDPTGADVVYINRWPLYGCIMFGSLVNAPNVGNLPTLAVDPSRRQGNWLQLAKKSDAVSLNVGDLVMAATAGSFTIGGKYFPNWGEMDRIEQVDRVRGRVLMRYSPTKGKDISILRPLAPPGRFWARGEGPRPNASIGVPLWASWKSGIVGGTWIAKAASGFELPFTAGGGGLDCTIKPHAVSAGWGVGSGNLLSHCQVSVDREDLSVTPFELAYLSSDNQVAIGEMILRSAPRTSDWVINFDEAAHDNTVKVSSFVNQSAGIKDVVSIFNAQNNNLTIANMSGTPISGSVVAVYAYTYAGSYPLTQGNRIEIDASTLKTGRSYVTFGTVATQNNMVLNSAFSGSPAGANGATGTGGAAANTLQNVQLH